MNPRDAEKEEIPEPVPRVQKETSPLPEGKFFHDILIADQTASKTKSKANVETGASEIFVEENDDSVDMVQEERSKNRYSKEIKSFHGTEPYESLEQGKIGNQKRPEFQFGNPVYPKTSKRWNPPRTLKKDEVNVQKGFLDGREYAGSDLPLSFNPDPAKEKQPRAPAPSVSHWPEFHEDDQWDFYMHHAAIIQEREHLKRIESEQKGIQWNESLS